MIRHLKEKCVLYIGSVIAAVIMMVAFGQAQDMNFETSSKHFAFAGGTVNGDQPGVFIGLGYRVREKDYFGFQARPDGNVTALSPFYLRELATFNFTTFYAVGRAGFITGAGKTVGDLKVGAAVSLNVLKYLTPKLESYRIWSSVETGKPVDLYDKDVVSTEYSAGIAYTWGE